MDFYLKFILSVLFFVVDVQPGFSQTKSKQPSIEGNWAFVLPDGNGAWLSLNQNAGEWQGSLLWSVGSAKPVTNLKVMDDQVSFSRKLKWKPGGGKTTMRIVAPFEGKLGSDGQLKLTVQHARTGGKEVVGDVEEFEITGERISPYPARPVLSKAQFGQPVELFNGKDLKGWKLSNARKLNGWKAVDGILTNSTPKSDFSAYGEYGNLVTESKFEDFELTIEYNVPEAGNSGIYLRGMYEAQVVDRESRMQGINGPGAIFGRIAPPKNVANPGGQWNKYVLTLAKRHITVVLNDQLLIDNQKLIGPTGGGILTHDDKPGPIFLQGDHTSVKYRNIVLRPIVGYEND